MMVSPKDSSESQISHQKMKKLALAAYILLGTAGNNRPLISIAGGSKYLTLAALKFLECLRIVKMTGVGGERGRKIYSLVSRIFK